MTLGELYRNAKTDLSTADVDSPELDAQLLIEQFLGFDRTDVITHSDKDISKAQNIEAFLYALKRRCDRIPLQYILGSWEFMGLELAVTEGVLCPRDDTATLVYALEKKLSTKFPTMPPDVSLVGVDLCAGTGAVALGLCSLIPETSVTAIELYDEAFDILNTNIDSYAEFDVRALQGDITSAENVSSLKLPALDFIASNPPYIAKHELSSLQKEVQIEPQTALDGGTDGLSFYRAIASPMWLDYLRPQGIVAVEIGDTQAAEVSEIFNSAGLVGIETHKDLHGLDRAITASKI